MSTFLYTGNGSTQTITNGIDLSTNGGLVWIKARTLNADHLLYDTSRGVNKVLYSNSTVAQDTTTASLTAFNNNGFSVNATGGYTNSNTYPYASWTFRKQPKFFDVVTWTGNGDAITVNHNLGSVPGCIIIKAFSSSPTAGQNWLVYHRSIENQGRLNETSAFIYSGISNVTSTSFEPSGTGSGYNVSGVQYIGYVFAHNAGGFGLTGTDNVISCGSFTCDGSGVADVNLGYEPQFLLTKCTSNTENWNIVDNMRGWTNGSVDALLYPNLTQAETDDNRGYPTATGFRATIGATRTYIYIAIRRGPMKVPTSGTSVYNTATDIAANTEANVGFPADMTIQNRLSGGTHVVNDRLRGSSLSLYTDTTAAEGPFGIWFDSSVGFWNGHGSGYHYYGTPNFTWAFKRAPSFFDEVCYTGTGTPRTITHNLTVAPQLMIIKRRSAASFNGWPVYVPTSTAPRTNVCLLNTTASAADSSYFNSTAPTSTVFSVDDHQDVNASGNTYVAYLFATCAGVSKVGSYTGTGALQTVNCGFTSGARFVLIKRTDSTGDWYVYDSARGITSGNDPYLFLNSTAAEVTGTNYVDTDSTGFKVTAAAPAELNNNGSTFIFLAIA
jgi:hypothetical protein